MNDVDKNCDELVALYESLDVPVLDRVQVGITGYLDTLTFAQLDAPVMKGRDEGGRRFIACRVNEKLKFVDGDSDEAACVVVAFERYIDNSLWVHCHGDAIRLSVEHSYMPSCAKLKSLIAGDVITTLQDEGYSNEHTVTLRLG